MEVVVVVVGLFIVLIMTISQAAKCSVVVSKDAVISYAHHSTPCGPGSSVGIATGYGLDGSGIESRVGWGARFSAPVQTGPDAHPASCAMVTGSFPGVKYGRGVTLTPHHF